MWGITFALAGLRSFGFLVVALLGGWIARALAQPAGWIGALLVIQAILVAIELVLGIPLRSCPHSFRALGTLVMLALWRVFEGSERITRRDWPAVIALGIIGNTGYQFFFISAIKYSSASNTSLIVATAPIWVALFGGLLKLERLSVRSWLGILLLR